MTHKGKMHSCDCSEAMPYLIFDNRTEEPFVKKRVKATWKSLDEVKDAILKLPSDEQIKEVTPEPAHEPDEKDGIRLLFEKMLSKKMDQHALAIADGYRTRPQVCVCDNVCCDCFDYSNFLHNLKLHNHKALLRAVHGETAGKRKPDPKSETIESSFDEESKESNRDVYDEFTLKKEEDYEGDDPNDVDLDLSIIERVKKMACTEKTVCPEKKVGEPAPKPRRGVRVIKIDEPPYETKFNSVHRRLREFDPNEYKTLVRDEIRRLNEVPVTERRRRAENRIKNPSQRPPWKI